MFLNGFALEKVLTLRRQLKKPGSSPMHNLSTQFQFGQFEQLVRLSHPMTTTLSSCTQLVSESPLHSIPALSLCLFVTLLVLSWHVLQSCQLAQQLLCFRRRFLMSFSAYFICSLASGTVGQYQATKLQLYQL